MKIAKNGIKIVALFPVKKNINTATNVAQYKTLRFPLDIEYATKNGTKTLVDIELIYDSDPAFKSASSLKS